MSDSMQHMLMVKEYLIEMGMTIVEEDAGEQLFIVDKEDDGIKHMIVDCEDEILVVEQAIMPMANADAASYKRLLEINRELLHGAFCLNTEDGMLIYRDTLQLSSLDINELEASVRALSLALAEFSSELLAFAKA